MGANLLARGCQPHRLANKLAPTGPMFAARLRGISETVAASYGTAHQLRVGFQHMVQVHELLGQLVSRFEVNQRHAGLMRFAHFH